MSMNYPRIILAGTNSSVGKTTLTIGLILALRKRGLKVQPFKAGPDYIDPSYHTFASGRSCRNLDTWMLSKDTVLELFERQAKLSDISIIEGVMGLYDGLKNREEGSSAHLAKLLNSPLLLIVDATSLSRSAGAVVLGYKEFDKDVDIRGIILNNIGSLSHYHSTKYAIENKTGLPVLGFLPRDKNLILPERHLGLIPTDEKVLLNSFTKKLLSLIEKNIDIDRIIEISWKAKTFPRVNKRLFDTEPLQDRVTIAVAKDPAFNFYYQDNLDILRHLGAKLVEFSPLSNEELPEYIDGLYIGGGFPELFAKRLSRNTKLKNAIYQKAKQGLPIYAECGGLIYLVKRLIDFKKRTFPMIGLFKCSVNMASRLQGLGYVNVETIKDNILSKRGVRMRAHIFHWSFLDDIDKGIIFAYKIKKDKIGISYDGLLTKNVLASYVHLHFASHLNFAKNFIKSCQEYKNAKGVCPQPKVSSDF